MADLTVGDLRRTLESYPDDAELGFSGGMTFYRLKWRGPNLVMLEFSEPEAYLSPQFRKKNPDVFVAFFRPELTDEMLQVVTVPEL